MESLTPQPIDPSDELTVRGPVRVERKVAGVSAPKMSKTGKQSMTIFGTATIGSLQGKSSVNRLTNLMLTSSVKSTN